MQLQQAGVRPTVGDIRCIVFGHLTRMAIWKLRSSWVSNRPTREKLAAIAEAIWSFGDPEQIAASTRVLPVAAEPESAIYKVTTRAQKVHDAVAF